MPARSTRNKPPQLPQTDHHDVAQYRLAQVTPTQATAARPVRSGMPTAQPHSPAWSNSLAT